MDLPLFSFILTLLISLTTATTTLPPEYWTTKESSNGPTKSHAIPKLPLAVHYEALCPESMYFIRIRLQDALQNNNWWPRVDLKLYPFGTAKFYNNTALNRMEVHCQHGEKQCELNALHACVLEELEVKSAFQLINCMLRSYGNVIDECANQLKLNVTAVKKCKSSRSTAEILTLYGKEALAIQLSVVPSNVFDNRFRPRQQRKIPYNFEAFFCNEYNENSKLIFPLAIDYCVPVNAKRF